MSEPISRDEWVEKAAKAACEFEWPDGPWDVTPLDYADSTRAALAAVVDDIRADALQAAATAYQMGGWAKLPQAAGNLATKRTQAEHAVAWLRDRADQIGGRHE